MPGVSEAGRVGDLGRRIVAVNGPAGVGIVRDVVVMVDSLPWRVLGRVNIEAMAVR